MWEPPLATVQTSVENSYPPISASVNTAYTARTVSTWKQAVPNRLQVHEVLAIAAITWEKRAPRINNSKDKARSTNILTRETKMSVWDGAGGKCRTTDIHHVYT